MKSIPLLFLSASTLLASAAHALEPDVLFEKVSPSVWSVITQDAQGRTLAGGSAVVIGAGRLVTNCHVLAKASSFSVKRENVSYGATLEYPDPERDLCQIKVANFTAPSVEIALLERTKVGQKAYAIGNPRGLEVTLSDGLVSGLRRKEDGSLEAVQTTAPISPGSSGGGLFDTEGRLIGITTYALRESQNLNFAVPSTWIAELAERGKAALDKRTAAAIPAPTVTARATAPVLPASPPAPAPPAAAPVLPAPPTARDDAPAGGARTGDVFEYRYTDRMTGKSQLITYRVDRADAERVVYNGGQRVENAKAEVLQAAGAPGGQLDLLTPPGGWVEVAQSGGALRFRSRTITGANVDYRLTATSHSAAPLTTAAGEFQAVRIDLEGWCTTSGREAPNDFYAARYTGTVWWVPALGRIVRLSVRGNNTGRATPVHEEAELVRMERRG